MLITNELVTRALRQDQFTSGEDIELRVWPELLIEKLADRWSIDTHERHACAWFEIDRHEPRASRRPNEV
jgi:hypothetical protein